MNSNTLVKIDRVCDVVQIKIGKMFSSIQPLKPSSLKSGKYAYCGDSILGLFMHSFKRRGKSKTKWAVIITLGYLQVVAVFMMEAETDYLLSQVGSQDMDNIMSLLFKDL